MKKGGYYTGYQLDTQSQDEALRRPGGQFLGGLRPTLHSYQQQMYNNKLYY
ncbi:hypothetical protein EV102420_10_01120 [Pseudescherichia vulneris NBRC 102420]|uniref:Uncharacterized protein n=1 Tax=Pseudescherichia vulneris NBRC 102420 TaxID=1115515 RepID=A0A090V0C6_PSEVU|nr:hypothetical protein EV102420_10_01120 [Pseudescherichia vulneris NBRC 102420]